MSEPRAQLEQHHAEAFAWAVSCCKGNGAMAEDVLQTTYLKILEGRARYEGRSSFRTWLFSVIRHTATDGWRSPWHKRRRSITDADLQRPAPASEVDAVDLSRVADAVAGLAQRQSEVLTLVYGHGMTVREASAVLGISQGSAATHLHRGKQKLRKRLTDTGEKT